MITLAAASPPGSRRRLSTVTEREPWLGAVWPFVREWLPDSPARVVEIGCGSLGGFVPRLEQAGYEATGDDPGWLHGQRAEWRESGLAATSEADERAAIDAGLIQANRIQYAGRRGER
jgi:hypothetical protein